jgi:hypothetical protein
LGYCGRFQASALLIAENICLAEVAQVAYRCRLPSDSRSQLQLCGYRVPCRCPQPCLCRDPLAARCQSVCFSPAQARGPGATLSKGQPLKKLAAVLRDRRVSWQRYHVSIWYGRTNRLVEIATGTALWYRSGVTRVPMVAALLRFFLPVRTCGLDIKVTYMIPSSAGSRIP